MKRHIYLLLTLAFAWNMTTQCKAGGGFIAWDLDYSLLNDTAQSNPASLAYVPISDQELDFDETLGKWKYKNSSRLLNDPIGFDFNPTEIHFETLTENIPGYWTAMGNHLQTEIAENETHGSHFFNPFLSVQLKSLLETAEKDHYNPVDFNPFYKEQESIVIAQDENYPENISIELPDELLENELKDETLSDNQPATAAIPSLEISREFAERDSEKQAASWESSIQIGLEVWPNPSQGRFQFQMEHIEKGKVLIEVRTLAGDLVLQGTETAESDSYNGQLDLGTFPAGIYLLRVQSGESQAMRKLIVL